MKIRHRITLNNILVALIPVFLFFIIFIAIVRSQIKKDIVSNLESAIQRFSEKLESDTIMMRSYAFSHAGDILSKHLTTRGNISNLIFRFNKFDATPGGVGYDSAEGEIKVIEYTYRDHSLQSHAIEYAYTPFYIQKSKLASIWEIMDRPSYHKYFRMSFPDLVSNTLVIRNTAIIYDEIKHEKAGLVITSTVINQHFLSEAVDNSVNMIAFIESDNGLLFSEDIDDPIAIESITKYPASDDLEYRLVKVKGRGDFYFAKKNLYSETSRVNNKIVRKRIADFGILYSTGIINQQVRVLRIVTVLLSIFVVIIVILVAFYLARKIAIPLQNLDEMVNKFQLEMKVISGPEIVNDEISSLQLRFSEMSENVVRYNRAIKEQNDKMLHDLELARHIQNNYINLNTNIRNISLYYKPMEQVGGDYFEIIELNEDDLGIFISDVAGHGVSAALVSSMIKSFTQQFGKDTVMPSELLTHLNDYIHSATGEYFVTAFYGIYRSKKRDLIYANAGHNPPFLINKLGPMEMEMNNSGLPLGVVSSLDLLDMNRQYKDNTLHLKKKNKILFYTDGLTESVNFIEQTEGKDLEIKDFFNDRLFPVLHVCKDGSASDLVQKLVSELIDFRGKDEFDDDVCIICMDIE